MKNSILWISCFLFVSTISAQAARRDCLFGEELSGLSRNRRLSLKADVIKTFKISRHSSTSGTLLWVAVDELKDRLTGRVYHLNRTFLDQYDGGNTLGWIEDLSDAGAIVAQIHDSTIEACRVTR